jgi:quercetin dioxygenase-like cupin family protein
MEDRCIRGANLLAAAVGAPRADHHLRQWGVIMNDVPERSRRRVPTLGGSTYIKPSEMEWQPTRFDKVSIKVLYEDAGRGEMTCLLKLEPGAHIPFHQHPEIEQSLVLEGSVEDHDGVATAGDYVWRKPGSLHDNRSPGGAVLFAVYRKPNIYYHAAKETAGF